MYSVFEITNRQALNLTENHFHNNVKVMAGDYGYVHKKSIQNISVLLTGWGGFAGTSIIDCLKNNYEKRKIRVICADMAKKPILQYKADGFHILPKGNSTNYISSLIKLCKKEHIKVVMPGSGPEIISISKNIERLTSNNIYPTIMSFSKIKKIMNKSQMYKILHENKISVPDYYYVNNGKKLLQSIRLLGYPKRPVCFKPSSYSSSGGARGFRILRKINSLEKTILDNKPGSSEIDFESVLRLSKIKKKLDLLIMEFLPGKEYSVYVFAKNGKMLYCVPNVRDRLEQHYSFEAHVESNSDIEKICKKIVEIFDLNYNVNIQLKFSRYGKPKVVEINPRMGGTIALPMAAGINLPYFALKQALGEKIPKNKKFHKSQMIRYWKELFVTGTKPFELS